MESRIAIEFLKRNELFKDLSEENLSTVIEKLEEENMDIGSILFSGVVRSHHV